MGPCRPWVWISTTYNLSVPGNDKICKCIFLVPQKISAHQGLLNSSVTFIFRGHVNVISDASCSADERKLVTVSWDKSIAIWDISTGMFRYRQRNLSKKTTSKSGLRWEVVFQDSRGVKPTWFVKIVKYANVRTFSWTFSAVYKGVPVCINLLAHERCGSIFKYVIFVVNDIQTSLCEIAVSLMWMGLSDDESTLVQVMAWCPQATSHYLSQCWPNFVSP